MYVKKQTMDRSSMTNTQCDFWGQNTK